MPRLTFARMLEKFCQQRATTILSPRDAALFQNWLLGLFAARTSPPKAGHDYDWLAISDACSVGHADLKRATRVLSPGLDALTRDVRQNGGLHPRKVSRVASRRAPRVTAHRNPAESADSNRPPETPAPPRRKPGVRARPIVEFPESDGKPWDDPATFADALDLHMRRHGDSSKHLAHVLANGASQVDETTLNMWRRGVKVPRAARSLAALEFIERRYRLPSGYFRHKLPMTDRCTSAGAIAGISRAERRRLAWHLPFDFDRRPLKEREEILEWVQRVVISGSTEYRRFQAAAMRQRYAVRFPGLLGESTRPRGLYRFCREEDGSLPDPELAVTAVDAPVQLSEEMADLVRFKTATLTAFGYQRNGVWGEETASQKVEHLGLMFGALAAAPSGAVHGFGVPLESLTFGLLVFPIVWDWYIQWRERRRGFYTAWEVDMLRIAIALTRVDTGWLRQSPQLADRIKPIPNLITERDIATVRADWAGACEQMHKHGLARAREVQRVARIHRDPFEPIMVVLEADSPVGEYRKITEEILRLMPDEKRYPRAAAEAVRAFLMLRLGLHLGLRQKNLRQLLVCPRGHIPSSERRLTELKRGELRWSERDRGWEVFIPSVAFKNANSSFFGSKPFRLILPDLGGLYHYLDAYIDRHRRALLKNAADPGTLFVKTVKLTSKDAAYDQNTFYEAWRLAIQRYGIHNPYTGRGAIRGLLPHGPHNVRDVLATHILKQTGSYEQASYAIQDTPDMVAKHYGRFLPQDKAALAAQILNRVWEAA
ncbi:hypothetical protein [Ancylobacter mangrovi]|uniref:hypothetical protein n=1 Tax=Ancylobacter mangrovi TaxID=2972472 RepID=UPI002161CD72|nr:hypothetical protein [Ancylobacter mangrovi]MCS0505144.1 hypothetical protein [Ancylobacter mangrovi]